MKTNKHAIERVNLNDSSIGKETKQHHISRYEFASKYITKNCRILDVCCGCGYGLDILRSVANNTTGVGIDVSQDAIDIAIATYSKKSNPPSKYIVSDVREIPKTEPLRTFDLITMFEAIEHIKYNDGVDVLNEINRRLNPGGTFIISAPRDINEKYNIYHKSLWGYAEIRNIIGSIFDDVEILGQDWETGTITSDNVFNNAFYIAVCKTAGGR